MVQPPTLDIAANMLLCPPLICSWLWKNAWIGLGTIWVGGRFTGGASIRNGLFGMRGKPGAGLPSAPHTTSSGNGLPSWPSCVVCSAVALAMPFAPGNMPYMLSKLWFSA